MPVAQMSDNAFTMLSFIAAPAVLTNASSVLALGTSNRFARSIDRARLLAKQITEDAEVKDAESHRLLMDQFERTQTRTLLLLKGLRCFYLALGCYSSSALLSLIGAGLAVSQHHWLYAVMVGIALISGTVGVCSMAFGSSLLVRETRLAVVNLGEEIALVKASAKRVRKRFEAARESGEGVEHGEDEVG